MPVAVWAASLCGGWIGAVLFGRWGERQSGLWWLGLGGAIGGLIGLVLWLLLYRLLLREKENVGQRPDSAASS